MKNLLIIFIALFTISLFSCKKTEYIDNKPQLEITVLNVNGEHIPNANVVLYESKFDWEEQSNAVLSGKTDLQGVVLFENLKERIYFFYVEKDSMTNEESVSVLEKELRINVRAIVTTILK